MGNLSGTALARSLSDEPFALGKFTLVEPIGQGGMAQLYLARTAGLGGFVKTVVVKRILPHLAEDAEFIARFIQEARLAATLNHPNIAAVYEVDVEEGIYFYSMEYVRGHDLRQVLRRVAEQQTRLALNEVIAVVAGLCAGLAHAHDKRDVDGEPLGIVHRDVSPSNVLVGFEGGIKLTDFGVAKARTSLVSTEAGALRGKLPYMSPEQCRGEALDRRSDVYAVGALMWEMLTGDRLHRAHSEVALIQKIARARPQSVLSERPDCPARLDHILQKALAPDPAHRYQSAARLRDDLEEFARTRGMSLSGSTVARMMANHFAEEVRPSPVVEAVSAVATGNTTATVAPSATTHPLGVVEVDDDDGDDEAEPDSEAFTRVRGRGRSELPNKLPPTSREPPPEQAIVTRSLSPLAVAGPNDYVSFTEPELDEELEPVADASAFRPRGRGLVAVLALGTLVGLGSFVVAGNGGDDVEPTSAATERRAPTTVKPAATPDASKSAAATEPAGATAPAATPRSEPEAQVEAQVDPTVDTAAAPQPAPTTAAKKSRRRRNRKTSPKPKPEAKPINLDSAMPPGM